MNSLRTALLASPCCVTMSSRRLRLRSSSSCSAMRSSALSWERSSCSLKWAISAGISIDKLCQGRMALLLASRLLFSFIRLICSNRSLIPDSSINSLEWFIADSTYLHCEYRRSSSNSTSVILTPVYCSAATSRSFSLGRTILTARPSLPALAVLPTRCTQSSGRRGKPQLTTVCTDGMSKPLELTSVVTRMFAEPCLNLLRFPILLACFMYECRQALWQPSRFRVRCSSWHSLQVPANTIADPLRFFTRSKKMQFFRVGGAKINCCTSWLTVFKLPIADTDFTVEVIPRRAHSYCPSSQLRVAEASTVCLSRGRELTMALTAGNIVGQARRSASSRTSTSHLPMYCLSFSLMSSIYYTRPGVPTMMCGTWSSWLWLVRQLVPPISRAVRSLNPSAYSFSFSTICIASSLLGASITPNTPNGFSLSL